jgi:hypothetical protein
MHASRQGWCPYQHEWALARKGSDLLDLDGKVQSILITQDIQGPSTASPLPPTLITTASA